MDSRAYPPTHRYCGANSERQAVGDPGHCERCAQVGHIVAHPEWGCGDVECNSSHEDMDANETDTTPSIRWCKRDDAHPAHDRTNQFGGKDYCTGMDEAAAERGRRLTAEEQSRADDSNLDDLCAQWVQQQIESNPDAEHWPAFRGFDGLSVITDEAGAVIDALRRSDAASQLGLTPPGGELGFFHVFEANGDQVIEGSSIQLGICGTAHYLSDSREIIEMIDDPDVVGILAAIGYARDVVARLRALNELADRLGIPLDGQPSPAANA